MDLLNEISSDLLNESAGLSNTLRKAKVLATQISLPEFREWVDSELEGYSGNDTVPEYRSFRPSNFGTFSGPFGSIVRNMAIPTYNLPDSVKEFAENLRIYDGIGALEGMLSQDTETFQINWTPELVILSREVTRLEGDMILVQAHQPIPLYFISGIMDKVKNKLLDFILAMQDSDITSEDLENRTVESSLARNIFNTVNVYGHNAVVASGGYVNQEVSLVREGDVESLLGHLSELGVDGDTLGELEVAVSAETSARNGEFGPKVKAWLGGAVAKATSGAWQVGVTTVTKEVIEALNKYYGI